MEIVEPTPDHIAAVIEKLGSGDVIAHATETCYGLACDLTNVKAVEKLFRIKDRPLEQPVSGLFASVEQAKLYTQWNDLAEELAHDHLPGPLTMILKLRTDAPHKLFATPGGAQTIGVRISSHPTAMQLAQEFGVPLSTTSANVHGKPNPYSVKDIESQYAGRSLQPDVTVDGGVLEQSDASTVIDISSNEIHVLRAGPLTF